MSQSPYWSPAVCSLTPYVPGEQPKLANLIKLNTNENPYPPSPAAIAAAQAAAGEDLRLYPDPDATSLRQAIGEYYGIPPERVFVGNGSDEVLAHVFLGLLKHPKPILFPDVTYSFYPVYCKLYGIDYRTVPLSQAFTIHVEDYMQPNGGIIFPNPNAPTGRLLAVRDIERLAAGNRDSVVVIDEAYIDFGGESAVALTAHLPNLLVIQTLSKSRSLAGLRVGFAIGDWALIEGLDRVKNSFNSYPLDRVAIAAASAAMADRAYFEKSCRAVVATRDTLTAGLEALGFEVLPSAANFVFARHPAQDAAQLAANLRSRHIVVRHFPLARIAQFLRITVGTDEQCESLLAALRELVR
ncbi:MAG: histidinol-phosphate transaminase [Betaproteobacteria bacterium]|nr:histidinol-phosphate transaminase [Betaproteobacteria bacterium]